MTGNFRRFRHRLQAAAASLIKGVIKMRFIIIMFGLVALGVIGVKIYDLGYVEGYKDARSKMKRWWE